MGFFSNLFNKSTFLNLPEEELEYFLDITQTTREEVASWARKVVNLSLLRNKLRQGEQIDYNELDDTVAQLSFIQDGILPDLLIDDRATSEAAAIMGARIPFKYLFMWVQNRTNKRLDEKDVIILFCNIAKVDNTKILRKWVNIALEYRSEYEGNIYYSFILEDKLKSLPGYLSVFYPYGNSTDIKEILLETCIPYYAFYDFIVTMRS